MNKRNNRKTKQEKEQDPRECPYCGQKEIPFKMGVCICGRQVGSIKYVNNAKKFAKSYYEYLGVIT